MAQSLTFFHLDLWQYLLVAGLGVIASIINMLAGGGSNLILPTLIVMGVPTAIANGTNRVGVFLQGLVGLRAFHKADKLPTDDMPGILVPTVLGGLLGSLLASYAPEVFLKPALLLTMLAMAGIMLLRPNVVTPAPGTMPHKVRDSKQGFFWLFMAGVYGGFVQAGVGFVLIMAFAGVLRYDLVRANALKLACTIIFTAVALAVFIVNGQIWWDVGIVLAIGNMLGAWLGVRIAISIAPAVMKRILFAMTVAAVVAALFS
ncbi:MAG: sulfite exporter TauE/SafE family protein [Cardiobacteriaceae bacterium]|nr:sulfite exporter TauE/SafE family protein [Cardiobacteriaceae bacterium]